MQRYWQERRARGDLPPGEASELQDMARWLEAPRYVVLRDSVFNHLAHHRGQLTVYLRLTGAPVPAIYGPSADDGRF